MLATQKKTLKAGKLVDTGHVNTLIRNYKRERWVHNSKRIGKEDSLSVWYSIEELETERSSVGITKGILVQASNNFEDILFLYCARLIMVHLFQQVIFHHQL